MSIGRPAGILLVSLATALSGCDDNGTRIGFGSAGPAAPFVGASPFVGATLLPSTIGFTSVAGSRCPSIAPFLASFSLFIDQRSGSDIFLDEINFHFGDRSGRRSPLQLTRSDLARMFGTTFVSAGATRTFDFSPQFGCGLVSVPSLLFIDLTTLNRGGVRHQSTLTATLR
jgi:hypothetical protein